MDDQAGRPNRPMLGPPELITLRSMVRFHLAPRMILLVAYDGDARPTGGGGPLMWKKLLLLVGIVGAAAFVAKKVNDANDERAL